MNRNKSQRILSAIVIFYMMLALLWWSFLLMKKNDQTYRLESQLHPTEMEQIEDRFQRQKSMIMGEALVFGLSLVLGIYFINNAYAREVRTNQKQNNFLLSVTHELKSPLSSIKLILQTFLKRDLDRNKEVELTGNALNELSRLEEMVNNLLLTTKLDHHYQYNFETEDIVALMVERINVLGNRYPEAEISLSQTNPFHAEVDREAFTSLIGNLVENAIKYSPKGNAINIELEIKDEMYLLLVKDLGYGIPEELRKKVLEKFYRIGDENVRKSKGSGLGLYIVNEIVKEHKGKVDIRNNQPQGTVISIELPIKIR